MGVRSEKQSLSGDPEVWWGRPGPRRTSGPRTRTGVHLQARCKCPSDMQSCRVAAGHALGSGLVRRQRGHSVRGRLGRGSTCHEFGVRIKWDGGWLATEHCGGQGGKARRAQGSHSECDQTLGRGEGWPGSFQNSRCPALDEWRGLLRTLLP